MVVTRAIQGVIFQKTMSSRAEIYPSNSDVPQIENRTQSSEF